MTPLARVGGPRHSARVPMSRMSCWLRPKGMIKRMDNVGIVVDDLKAAIAFLVELGLESDGEMAVEGSCVDRCVGLDGAETISP